MITQCLRDWSLTILIAFDSLSLFSFEEIKQTCFQGPILDVCWHDDGSKVFMASCDKQVKCWDLASNQTMQVAQHEAPVKVIRWVKAPNYTALMTGSWDKTLKFWDTRSSNPIMTIDVNERCYAADVDYPMAVVGTAGRYLRCVHIDFSL